MKTMKLTLAAALLGLTLSAQASLYFQGTGVGSGSGEEALRDVPEGQRATLSATWESCYSAELKHVREELNFWRDEVQSLLRQKPPGIPGGADDPMAQSDIDVYKSWTRKLEAERNTHVTVDMFGVGVYVLRRLG